MAGLWGLEGALPQGQPHSWQPGFSAATAASGRSKKGLRKLFVIKKEEKTTFLSLEKKKQQHTTHMDKGNCRVSALLSM